MHEIMLAMKTDIIVATAGDKRGCYFTAYITFCDYITHSSCMACLMLTQQVKVLPSST